MPKVSIIIPTHNRCGFVGNAIASALNQTFEDFELIIVDDASTDKTAETVAFFNDERIKFIRHEKNKGGSAARNTGITNSSGNCIAFLDDDDEWFPDKLSKQMEVLSASPPQIGGVYTGYVMVDRASLRVMCQYSPKKKGNLFHDLLVDNCVGGASCMLLRRECLDKVGLFDESLPCSQDYDLWIRIAKEFSFECIGEPYFKYYTNQSAISTDFEAQTKGLKIMARKYPLARSFYVKQYLEIGIQYCLSGNLNEGRKTFLRAIRLSPLQIRGYWNLCLILFGAQNFAKIKAATRKVRFSLAGDGGQVGR
jgi:glycosyltransferase involved in cell wall biosynthesis